MHSIDSVWLKIVRAKKHLDCLNAEIKNFWTLKPYEVVPEGNPKEPPYIFSFKVNMEPPGEWSLIVGEITYNLRSALDHLTWQLALCTTREQNRRTEFPIFLKESEVLLIKEEPLDTNPEAQDDPLCLWWRRGRVELYLKRKTAVMVVMAARELAPYLVDMAKAEAVQSIGDQQAAKRYAAAHV